MRTLLISDLHLGSRTGSDVLRRSELRAPLLAEAARADRVVLLGDVLELRHGPPREALAAARGFFEELGGALRGRELVVVAAITTTPCSSRGCRGGASTRRRRSISSS